MRLFAPHRRPPVIGGAPLPARSGAGNRFVGRQMPLLSGDSAFVINPRKRKFRQEVPKMRVKITLACTECKQRNYCTKKNKKNDPDRLEMNKYCKFCRKHTLHRETK